MNFDESEFRAIMSWIPAAVSSLIFLILLAILIYYLLKRFLFRSQDSDTGPEYVEPQNHGVDQRIITSLPTFLYMPTNALNRGEATECSVCLCSMSDKAMVRLLPDCLHMFHVECIDSWLASHSTCPVCRTLVQPQSQPQKKDSIVAVYGQLNRIRQEGQVSN